MYRELVEHPQFVPEDVRKSIEFRRWYDRGRIWRIAAKEKSPRREATSTPRLSRATTEELIALLGNANGWRRDTAQRLLVERQDRAAIGPLNDIARKSTNPLTRLHAIWTLKGLNALEESLLRFALHDANAGVRENAIRLSAGLPALTGEIVALADDPDVRVRFQSAIALGALEADPSRDGRPDEGRRP